MISLLLFADDTVLVFDANLEHFTLKVPCFALRQCWFKSEFGQE